MKYKLTSENVSNMMKQVLSSENNPFPKAKLVHGIVNDYMLDTRGYEKEIWEMLAELPENFKKTGGGGWSFLQACVRYDESQWTGMHLIVEHLVVLGIASNQAEYLFPKEMWNVLPGSVPYFVIFKNEE